MREVPEGMLGPDSTMLDSVVGKKEPSGKVVRQGQRYPWIRFDPEQAMVSDCDSQSFKTPLQEEVWVRRR